LEAADEGGVQGEVEEEVGQGGGHGVAAGDDDGLGVAVQVPAVLWGLGAFEVG
jgi:hypothetical protein